MNKWININDKLPEFNKLVSISNLDYESTGRLRESGHWSIIAYGSLLRGQIKIGNSKPTHWKEII